MLLLVLIPVTVASAQSAPPAKKALMDTADHSGGWVGKTAQPFTLTDSDDKVVDLSKVIGTKPVVLIFYRGAWCPYCHSAMADLSLHKKEFQDAGAAVFAISNEESAKLKEMQTAENLRFVTFLSDPDGRAAKLYAGLYPNSLVHQPGSFVVDKRGMIVYAYVNQDFKSRAATTALLKAVGQSQANRP